MSSFLSVFKFAATPTYTSELPVLFPMCIESAAFVREDILAIYSKILTDCVARTEGLSEEIALAMWDNCLASEANKGLISLLSEAMTDQKDLFLVWKEGVLRIADNSEKEKIKADYMARGTSQVGVFLSFAKYRRTTMLKIYSGMEYSTLNGLNKSMNVAAAIQFKMASLRKSVSAVDSQVAIDQANGIASALKNGRDVLLDGEDEIANAVVDMEPAKAAISLLDAKRAFYLGLPLSYLTGEQTQGIGASGEADAKAIDRGLYNYWVSILMPTIKALFGLDSIKFKFQDFRQIEQALNALRTFELVSDNLLSLENKRLIVSDLAGVENDVKGKPEEPELVEEEESDGGDEEE